MRRFNIIFPVIFVLCEAIIIIFVSSLMHFLTFTVWSIYNTFIVLFWGVTVVYTKSYNIGRGISYLNTIQLALKSIFILFSVVAIGNLFVNYYTFSIKSISSVTCPSSVTNSKVLLVSLTLPIAPVKFLLPSNGL